MSAELAVGGSRAGSGGGLTGKAALRLHPASDPWVFGLRIVASDGARRTRPNCPVLCDPTESLTEAAALVYRTVPLSRGSGVLYIGAGIGRLTGRQFIGDSSEFEELSQVGLSLEAGLHTPQRGFRLVLACHGHVGSGSSLVGASIGIGLGR